MALWLYLIDSAFLVDPTLFSSHSYLSFCPTQWGQKKASLGL